MAEIINLDEYRKGPRIYRGEIRYGLFYQRIDGAKILDGTHLGHAIVRDNSILWLMATGHDEILPEETIEVLINNFTEPNIPASYVINPDPTLVINHLSWLDETII